MENPLSTAALAIQRAVASGNVLPNKGKAFNIPNGSRVHVKLQDAPCQQGSQATGWVFLEIPHGAVAVVKRIYAKVSTFLAHTGVFGSSISVLTG